MKKYLFTVLLIGIFACKSSNIESKFIIHSPESVGLSTRELEKMKKNINSFVEDGKIPFVQTAIIKDNKLIHLHSYGYGDIESKIKVNENSIFRIYSMTKPIVSVAIMILVERGIIKLDDKVKHYISDFENLVVYNDSLNFKKPKADINISDLLSHKSGFGYGWGSNSYIDSMYTGIWENKNNEEFVKQLADIPLYFDPKSSWRYGVSTDVLGYLIEVVTGKPLYDFLYENIFDPLQMFDTSFQIPKKKLNRFVSNYQFDVNENRLDKVDDWRKSRYQKVSMHSGGGGLISTISDYINFCLMLSNDGSYNGIQVLSSESINLMTKNQIGSINYPWDEGVKFGYGFSVVTDESLSKLIDSNGSFGWSGAAGTRFTIDPEKKLILILMTQRMHPWSGVWKVFNDMTYLTLTE